MRILLVAAAVSAVTFPAVASAQSLPPGAPPVKRYVPPEPRIAINMRGVCEAWKIRAANPGQDCKDPGNSQRFRIGQVLKERVAYTSYPQIPYSVRHALNLDAGGRYIYDTHYLYAVDPETRAVTDVVKVQTR